MLKEIFKKIIKKLWNIFDYILYVFSVPTRIRVKLRNNAKALKANIVKYIHNLKRIANKPERACKCKRILGRATTKFKKPRLLVDVSILCHTNAKSGIQRVVIRLLDAMLDDKRRVYIPVARLDNVIYRTEYHQDDCSFHICEKMDLKTGDVALMLDSSWDRYDQFIPFFNSIHAAGGKVYQVVYDLVPILQPQFSVRQMVQMFEPMIKTAISNVDGMACISKTVADQLRDYIQKTPLPQYADPLKIGHFALGADFVDTQNHKYSPLLSEIFTACEKKKKFISVSTIEPRKNYDFMLSVVEELWARGYDIVYWIIGKKGWMVDDLAKRLQTHQELNKRLFWFSSVDDTMLQQLYKKADILLNLSHGEGYGLSLVEGAHYQCSIIATDMPVFREVISDTTTLFCNIDSLDETVNAIANKLDEDKFIPSQAKYYVWRDALKQLLDIIENNNWDYEIGCLK